VVDGSGLSAKRAISGAKGLIVNKLVVSEWLTMDGFFNRDTMEQWFNP
jgi:hypothetical protein